MSGECIGKITAENIGSDVYVSDEKQEIIRWWVASLRRLPISDYRQTAKFEFDVYVSPLCWVCTCKVSCPSVVGEVFAPASSVDSCLLAEKEFWLIWQLVDAPQDTRVHSRAEAFIGIV